MEKKIYSGQNPAPSCMSLQLGSIFGVWSHNRALRTSYKYLSIRMMRPKQSFFSVKLLPLEKYIDMPMPLTIISLPKCMSHVSICQLIYEWRIKGTGKFEGRFVTPDMILQLLKSPCDISSVSFAQNYYTLVSADLDTLSGRS